jgi:four helix bundle protein
MATVTRFEDLICWQEGRKLVNLIYQLTNKSTFRDFSLKDQLRRAAVSVISNIAEGFERGTTVEFICFLYISKGSCGEVRTQLYVALDQKFINQDEFHKTCEQTKKVSALIYRLIESLKRSTFKGLKYKPGETKDAWEEFMKENYPDIYQKLQSRSQE